MHTLNTLSEKEHPMKQGNKQTNNSNNNKKYPASLSDFSEESEFRAVRKMRNFDITTII